MPEKVTLALKEKLMEGSDKVGKFRMYGSELVFCRKVAELKVWLKAQQTGEAMIHNTNIVRFKIS